MYTSRLFAITILFLTLGLLTGCDLNPTPGDDDPAPTSTPDTGYPPPDTGYPSPDSGGEQPSENGDAEPPTEPTPPPVAFPTTSLGEPTIIAALQSSADEGETVTHVVAPGEWLMQIARCYGVSYSAVINANSQLQNSNFIRPDMTLTIPNIGSDGPIYQKPCVKEDTVEAGETWIGLAEKHGTTTQILTQANPGSLFAGRTILVPSSQEVQSQVRNPSQDLVYNRGGNLAIWQSENGETAVYDTFNGNLIELVVNDSGTWAIAKVAQEETDDMMNIVLINLVDKNMGLVEVNYPLVLPAFNQITMIINDQNAAYMIQQDDVLNMNSFAIDNLMVVNKLQDLEHNIATDFVPNLNLIEEDANQFMLFDGSGVYRYAYDFEGGEQVVWQPEGDEEFGISLRPIAWSPAGQYLLIEVFYFEGFNYGVLDATTNEWQAIQNSGGYFFAGTAVWQNDGKLDVLNPWLDEAFGIGLTTYQPETTDGTLSLTQVSEDELDSSVSFSMDSDSPPVTILRSAPLNDGETYISVQISDDTGISLQIFRLDRENKQLVEHMDVESFGFLYTFSDNGNLMLMQQINNISSLDEVVHVDFENKATFSILEIVGRDSRNYNWVD